MAIFQAFNAAGTGFNMSTTGSTGWAFMKANPAVTLDLVEKIEYSDSTEIATYDVYGSSQIDEFTAVYWTDGYEILIEDLLYGGSGYSILSITGLNLYTTIDDLEDNTWYASLNGGHDTFYGNDYADLIRAGYGNDTVQSHGGHDIVYGEAGDDRVYGLSGDDDLYGGSGRDNLNGGYGSDYLNGGTGSDTLAGGPGKDYFEFDTRPSGTNIDRISDFKPADDTIVLNNKVFTRVGSDGWLSRSAFTVSSKAKDSSDRVIYNKITGSLSYDPDGTGAAAAIKIAQLKAGLTLSKSDFYIL